MEVTGFPAGVETPQESGLPRGDQNVHAPPEEDPQAMRKGGARDEDNDGSGWKKKFQNGATLCFFSGEKGLEKQKKIAFFNSAASLITKLDKWFTWENLVIWFNLTFWYDYTSRERGTPLPVELL